MSLYINYHITQRLEKSQVRYLIGQFLQNELGIVDVDNPPILLSRSCNKGYYVYHPALDFGNIENLKQYMIDNSGKFS